MNKSTLAIFGCTGSIGKSSLKVYSKNKDKFDLIYISANKNYKKLMKIQKMFKPKNYFLTSDIIKNKKFSKEKFFKSKKKLDYIISGVSGYEALDLNYKLVKKTKNLLLANKETIICGGKIFLKYAKKNNCKIIPIDSEHHCIDYFFKNFKSKKNLDKIFITASGGALFKKKINYNEKIKNVLNHPTWKMGKKITVDSSTFANKVLELFEAHILFDLPRDKLDIKIDTSSRVHAIIKLKNNIYIPILHNPKMEIPISNSLNVNNLYDLKFKNIKLDLLEPDLNKFPIIKLGYKILSNYGHVGMILFTVINDRLVKLYIDNKIKYGDITKKLISLYQDFLDKS